VTVTVPDVHLNNNPQDVIIAVEEPRRPSTLGWHARLQLDVLGLPVGAVHQCACSTASTVVIPAISEPVIPISAGVPRGNSRLINEARKIAPTGRAMTK